MLQFLSNMFNVGHDEVTLYFVTKHDIDLDWNKGAIKKKEWDITQNIKISIQKLAEAEQCTIKT